MRNKLFLILLMALIGAYLFAKSNSTDEVNIQDKLLTTHQSTTATTENTEQTKKNAIVAPKKQEAIKASDGVMTTELTYDSDPVVNNHLSFVNNQLCYRQLDDSNNYSLYLQQFKLRMESKQVKYFEDYKDYCENLNKKHPELSLKDKNKIINQMKNAKATSLWGKILSKEIEAGSLTDGEVQDLLHRNDPNILLEAPRYLESYYQKVVHWDLESVLGNHDYDYINYIQQNAHQLYLCNLGAECHPNSSVMAALCFRNQTSCGLDFNNYVTQVLTPGQQADIQLALNYLHSQYQ